MKRIEVTLTNPVYRDLERLACQAGQGVSEFIHRSLGRIAADQNAPIAREATSDSQHEFMERYS